MKRLLLSVAFAALVAAVSVSSAFVVGDFSLWLLFLPLPVFNELLLTPADDEYLDPAVAILSALTSTALYALAAYHVLGRRAARRLP